MKSLGTFESTAYGPPWNAMNGTGTTAGGTDLRPAKQAYIVAVDPNVVPLGTELFVWPNPFNHRGTFLADDTGGAILSKSIDFYDWRGRESQSAWGRRDVQVFKAQPGDSGYSGARGEREVPGRENAVEAEGDGVVSQEQRSGLLKALLWVVIVLGGAGLAIFGLTRIAGAGGKA